MREYTCYNSIHWGFLTIIKMTKEERTARLREIMAQRKLSAPAVGRMLKRSPQTVRSWCCAYVQRAIPEHLLELLERKLPNSGVAREQA